MSGKSAFLISSAAFLTYFIGRDMLDWPAQYQTSPIKMFFTVSVFLPWTVIVSGLLLGCMAGSLQDHWPLSSAVAAAFWSASVTVTDSPGDAMPQIGSST